MTLRHRLGRLERTANRLGAGGPCRLCWGTPVALMTRVLERDPHGPGFRVVGERLLDNVDHGRLTDDLRCRRCGAPAVRVAAAGVCALGAMSAVAERNHVTSA